MALKFGRLTLIPIGILASLPSCGGKDAQNEGFLPKLSEITVEDTISEETLSANSLWDKVLVALKMGDIDRSSPTAVVTSLGVPSTFVSSATDNATLVASRTATIAGDWASQKCAGVYEKDGNKLLIDIDPGAALAAKGLTITTGGFKVVNGVPTNLAAPAKVLLFKYKLGTDTNFRTAILTVPTTPPSTQTGAITPDTAGGTAGYPIAVYAHASTGGLAYEEIAQSLGDLQANHIVLAPIFPGEPLCTTYDEVGGKKVPYCTGANIADAAVGTKNPYVNDVTDLVGALECLQANIKYTPFGQSPVGNTTFVMVDKDANVKGTLNLDSFTARISTVLKATAEGTITTLLGGGASASSAEVVSLGKLAVLAQRPVAYAIGLGRGANVVNLALGRAGAINSVVTSTSDALKTTREALLAAGATPMFFSCSAMVSPQASFTAGKNKIYLDYWVKGASGFISDSAAASLNLIPAFAEIKANIATITADSSKDEDAKAAAIASYVQSIDGTFNIGLAHGGLQNWGKALFAQYLSGTAQTTSAGKTLAAAQGAGLVLHGLGDKVADPSNSKLLSNVAVGVTTVLEAKTIGAATDPRTVGGVRWLGLGITPAEGVTDNGHVSDTSFLTGKANTSSTTTGIVTNVSSVTAFENAAPSTVIGTWLATSCKTSVTADKVP